MISCQMIQRNSQNLAKMNLGQLKFSCAKSCTGGPRLSRTFYLRIPIFAASKNIPKFSIHGNLALIPSHICNFWMRFSLKLLKMWKKCSLIIRGFKIRGSLAEKLRGPPVL
jgi:hypothetical protein